jgi:phosphate transport system ATP-binding protein
VISVNVAASSPGRDMNRLFTSDPTAHAVDRSDGVTTPAVSISLGAPAVASSGAAGTISVSVQHLEAYYGTHLAIQDVNLEIPDRQVTAIIGPSGCGKSTLIRTMNRMHEMAPGARTTGHLFIHGRDIYAPKVDPVAVRRHVGMVFQKPNPFPTMSIFDNVAAGLTLTGRLGRGEVAERVERSIKRAALWDEVKDKLKQPGTALSGGQQQRLCIARALAVDPEVLLLDEPASALDPVATLRIEDLIRELSPEVTIVIVTHNMQQAARVSDHTAFMLAGDDRIGRLVEFGETRTLFTTPRDSRTEAYITGRFG